MTFPSLVPGQSSEKVTSSRGSLLPGTVRIPKFDQRMKHFHTQGRWRRGAGGGAIAPSFLKILPIFTQI